MGEPSDVALRDALDGWVASAVAGDRGAVDAVLAGIEPFVLRYCRARLGRVGQVGRSDVSAGDVAQQVGVAVVAALPGYRVAGRPFLAFVYSVAAHTVIDAQRVAAHHRGDPVAEVPDSVEVGDNPGQRVLGGELSAHLGRLLAQLPDVQREILVLRVAVGLSVRETADAVRSTPGAVRVAQHRGMTRLRQSLPEAGGGQSA